jgi:hypothetical protein
MVTVSILVVAIVALGGLAYPTVPVNTTSTLTQTLIQEQTLAEVTYSSYTQTRSYAYESSSYVPTATTAACGVTCSYLTIQSTGTFTFYEYFENYSTAYSTSTIVYHQVYEANDITGNFYNQTVTSSTTESSTVIVTSLVPVYSSLGLTDTVFVGISILVILLLAIMVARTVVTSKTKRQKS